MFLYIQEHTGLPLAEFGEEGFFLWGGERIRIL